MQFLELGLGAGLVDGPIVEADYKVVSLFPFVTTFVSLKTPTIPANITHVYEIVIQTNPFLSTRRLNDPQHQHFAIVCPRLLYVRQCKIWD